MSVAITLSIADSVSIAIALSIADRVSIAKTVSVADSNVLRKVAIKSRVKNFLPMKEN